MPLVLAALLAIAPVAPAAAPAAAAVLPSCSWNRPGQNPFMGDVVAAVDRYTDIPVPVRQRLKVRMAARSYDEVVSIRRDAIVGRARYGAAITGMHFGAGQVCGTVNRAQWTRDAQERGLVYCESGHCILVPTVCRNVSRITRQEVAGADAAAPTRVAGVAGSTGRAGSEGGGGGGGSGGSAGSDPGGAGAGGAGVAPGAESGAPAGSAAAVPQTSFSQAASPGATPNDAAGGSDSLGAAAGPAASTVPAHSGSWAAAVGGSGAAGFALGVDSAALPLRQLGALPPNSRGLLTDGGAPASAFPGSSGGLATGPLITPVTGPTRGQLAGNDVVPSPVPEPASAMLLLAGLGWLARRTVRKNAGH